MSSVFDILRFGFIPVSSDLLDKISCSPIVESVLLSTEAVSASLEGAGDVCQFRLQASKCECYLHRIPSQPLSG